MPDRGMGSWQEHLVPTGCILCGGRGEDRVLFRPRLSPASFSGQAFSARRKRRREHYGIVRCKTCGLVRSNPVLAPAQLTALYADSEFLFDEEAPYAAETYAQLTAELLGDDLAQGRFRTLLEIGCSSGFYLEKALALGIPDVLGFEPSRQCHQRANLTVRPYMVEDIFRSELVGQRHFDLAASFHVLDHLPNPLDVLRQVTEVLNPGGRLLLVCHDVDAFSAKLLRDFSPIFDVEHIYLFSENTLSRLLVTLGLEVERIGPLANTYPLGYWLRMAPFFKHLLPWLPESLLRKSLTVKAGNLFALARKG